MSGKSTLEKLAQYYNTTVELNEKTCRRFVKIAVNTGFYFVIDNSMSDENTLLVATDKHNDFVKVHNGHKTFEQLKTVLGESIKERAQSRPTKKAIEIFGELYEIEQ
ncbi:hypothetical protein [Vibrio vulnificus]|uniref:hypothetical protein n=1 Tax=Vibrio vulnificus TaxID=672 RepID=UPI0005FBD92F|nr:hypothetical protein [Vibrio vulnificus]